MSYRAKQILCIAILFVLLLSPIIYAFFTAIDLEYSWFKRIAYLAIVILLLLLPATFLKARTYFIIEGIFNYFFFPIEIASLYLNHQSASTAFLENILHTDIHESLELLLSMWPLCLVVVALWVIYFVITSLTENQYLLRPVWRHIVLIGIPVTVVAGVFAMIFFLMQVHNERSARDTISDAVGLVWMKLYKIYPYNLYVESWDIICAVQRQQRLQKLVKDFSFDINPHPNNTPALYVLVIGETARFDNFGINGYKRNTTPNLSCETNLISYDSAFSQANLTSFSVPLILTRATAANSEIAYCEKSLPEAFQEACYRASFITKQMPSGLIQRIMSACDDSYFYAKGIDVADNYDEEMIGKMAEMKKDSLQFFVLHSLGCHFRYELRYPASFAHFQPTFGHSFSYSMISEENKDLLINAYDNAILYTDYFLSEIIHYLDSLNIPSVMLYMSDHGESFWDDERKLSLHGSYKISEYEYHVPLLVWYSDEYKTRYPEKVQAMWKNKTTPVSSDVVFYSMLDLAGIEAVVDSTRSICSPYLVPIDSVRVFDGTGAVQTLVIH